MYIQFIDRGMATAEAQILYPMASITYAACY